MVVFSLLCPRSPLSWGRQLSWLKEALPPVPPGLARAAVTAERPIHPLPWGLGTQSQWRRSLKHAPLSFPDPESTALCSDRLIYTKQALFLSTKLGRRYQAVPAQKLELKTF